jgi:hypothetical protein
MLQAREMLGGEGVDHVSKAFRRRWQERLVKSLNAAQCMSSTTSSSLWTLRATVSA